MRLLKFICIVLLLSSCDFKPQDKVVPKWEMDVLGPLVKGDFTIQDIAELDSLHASHDFKLSDFGFPNVAGVPVPNNTGTPVSVGPFSTFDITNAFGSAVIQSGEIYFKISNGWEINLQSATFIFRSGSTTIFSQPITTIPKYNGSGTRPSYTSPVGTFSNLNVNDTLNLLIQNFTTTGGTITDVNRALTVEVFLQNIKIGVITLSSSEKFSIVDTSDFEITGNTIQSESVSGTLYTYVNNPLPVGFDVQVYFMDATKTIKLDSLFDDPEFIPANTQEKKLVTTLNQMKIDNLNKAEYARTTVKLSSPSSGTVTISNSVSLSIQMVGDLKLTLEQD